MRALEDLNGEDGRVTRDQYSTYFIVSAWNTPGVEFRGFKFHDLAYAKERINDDGANRIMMSSEELTEALNTDQVHSETHSFIHCYVRK